MATILQRRNSICVPLWVRASYARLLTVASVYEACDQLPKSLDAYSAGGDWRSCLSAAYRLKYSPNRIATLVTAACCLDEVLLVCRHETSRRRSWLAASM